MNDWVAIIGGGVGTLTTIGGAIAFVWNKIERRFEKIECDLGKCEERERQSMSREAVKLTVVELLWQEVMRHAPTSPVLDRAKRLLDDLKEHASLTAVLEAAAKLDLLNDREKRK